MAKVREYDSFAEIGTYLHRNDGEAYIKSYASSNEPLKVDASKDSEMVHRLRVTIHTEEDKSVKKDGSFYTKHVAASQTRYDGSNEQLPPSKPTPVSSIPPPAAQPSYGVPPEAVSKPAGEAQGLSALAVLKNFCDNHFNLTLAGLGLTVLALIIAVVALVK